MGIQRASQLRHEHRFRSRALHPPLNNGPRRLTCYKNDANNVMLYIGREIERDAAKRMRL